MQQLTSVSAYCCICRIPFGHVGHIEVEMMRQTEDII